MKLSARSSYALRMLVDLAERRDQGYISLKEISERQGISKKYLEQIVPLLNASDVLRANRGPRGGYMLAKDPQEYTVGEILRITEGSLAPVGCVDFGCERSSDCATLPIWKGLSEVISEYLDGFTLQDIVDQQRERYANIYVI